MKVFKFGGASVKDAEGIRNVAAIIQMFPADHLLVVISATGKTTNALEDVVKAYTKNTGEQNEMVQALEDAHVAIANELFQKNTSHPVYAAIKSVFDSIRKRFEITASANYDLVYDQIVSMGEIVSTHLVSHYLNEKGISNQWFDARKLIRTDSTYREGKVDWKISEQLTAKTLIPFFITAKERRIGITQGFIAGTSIDLTTTLGREGSDYTAAIMSYLLDAKDMTIWKDVPGVLNADPRIYNDAVKLDRISFKEAIELSYYGASVIHPKTIKPLQNKEIPLYVKSFIHPNDPGTVIQENESYDNRIPSFIYKQNQALISITPRDFSFIVEENLRDIFDLLAQSRVRVNMMQNSALSFSISADWDEDRILSLIKKLQEAYKVKYNTGCQLVTIRHYDQATIDRVTKGKEILVAQRSRDTARFVTRDTK